MTALIPDDLTPHADGGVLAGVRAGVGYVVLNNPDRLNALSRDMFAAGAAVVARMASDPDLRLLILTGAGQRAFAAGADISRFDQERAASSDVLGYRAATEGFFDAVADFPRPTLARIHGYCIGGGLALAVCCDLRLASTDARFGVPAGKLGLGYGYDGVKRLTDLVGPSRAKEIFFTARQFSADEARDMGLINQIAPAEQLDDLVADHAQRITANAPLTLAQIKAAAQEVARDEADRDTARIARMVEACFTSDDYTEGRRAFTEKRPPVFKGR